METKAYENILVKCPFDAGKDLGEMTVGQFIQEMPEVAEQVVGDSIKTALRLEQSGMSSIEAANMAFAPFAVRDEETGQVLRAEGLKIGQAAETESLVARLAKKK